MKRLWSKPVLFLILGLICSLTFSWGSALVVQKDLKAAKKNDEMGQFMRSWRKTRSMVHQTWNLHIESRFGVQRYIATNGAYVKVDATVVPDGFFPAWSQIRRLPEVDPDVDLYGFIENAYGWPLPCLQHTWTAMSKDKLEEGRAGSIFIASWRLPVVPIWVGWLVDGVFFACTFFFLARLPGIIRRYSRRAVGRCPGCGQGIRSTDGRLCDACGHAVTWLGA